MDQDTKIDDAATYFGITFKEEQQQAIKYFLSGKDTFVILPTGFGKSLCYQCLPIAIGSESPIIIVVSPLIALMKDQVQALRSRGIKAGFLIGDDGDDHSEMKRGLMDGEFELMYFIPEAILQTKISKAHCFSSLPKTN
uniref:DNA 3'-5' helicase n=1 Tax=Amphimedon queenslandica TaxID=400682 RepID=A0A1X7UR90_AMPQE